MTERVLNHGTLDRVAYGVEARIGQIGQCLVTMSSKPDERYASSMLSRGGMVTPIYSLQEFCRIRRGKGPDVPVNDPGRPRPYSDIVKRTGQRYHPGLVVVRHLVGVEGVAGRHGQQLPVIDHRNSREYVLLQGDGPAWLGFDVTGQAEDITAKDGFEARNYFLDAALPLTEGTVIAGVVSSFDAACQAQTRRVLNDNVSFADWGA